MAKAYQLLQSFVIDEINYKLSISEGELEDSLTMIHCQMISLIFLLSELDRFIYLRHSSLVGHSRTTENMKKKARLTISIGGSQKGNECFSPHYWYILASNWWNWVEVPKNKYERFNPCPGKTWTSILCSYVNFWGVLYVHRNYHVSTQAITQIGPVIVKEFDFFAFEEAAVFHMFSALVLGSHSLTSILKG